MKTLRTPLLSLLIIFCLSSSAQELKVYSPDKNIVMTIIGDKLSYSVTFKGREIVNTSQMGFEFKNEQPMTGGFALRISRGGLSMKHGNRL